jgi:hypothetical protein
MKGVWGRGAFSVALDVCPEVGRTTIRIERELIKRSDGRLVRRDSAGRCEWNEDDGPLVTTPPGSDPNRHPLPSRPRATIPSRKMTFLPGESASPADWKDLVRRWQFLALAPDTMGAPTRQRMTGGPPMLERDGSNLGQYLWTLREASLEAFHDLLEALRYVLPYAKDVQPTLTQEIERLVFLEMAEEDFKVPGWLLSTGTLRILALLACLRHPDPRPSSWSRRSRTASIPGPFICSSRSSGRPSRRRRRRSSSRLIRLTCSTCWISRTSWSSSGSIENPCSDAPTRPSSPSGRDPSRRGDFTPWGG